MTHTHDDQVLLELKEYAQEVDVEFVRKAVRAIGRCAIKLERAAERCINVLLELIQTKVNYVLQEAVIVIKARSPLPSAPCNWLPLDVLFILFYFIFFVYFFSSYP